MALSIADLASVYSGRLGIAARLRGRGCREDRWWLDCLTSGAYSAAGSAVGFTVGPCGRGLAAAVHQWAMAGTALKQHHDDHRADDDAGRRSRR